MEKIPAMILFVSLLGFSLASGPSYAAEPFSGGEHRVYGVSEMLGVNVKDPHGEDLGRVIDVVIDSHGNSAFAILSSNGFMGQDEKLVAIPFGTLSFSPDEKYLVLNMSKKELESAPAFDKKDMRTLRWTQDSNRSFGIEPYWNEDHVPGPAIETPMKKNLQKFPSDYDEVGLGFDSGLT